MSREAPPYVVAAREAGRDVYWCGVHAPRCEFPFMVEPVWHGDDYPNDARCATCGLDLRELEPSR